MGKATRIAAPAARRGFLDETKRPFLVPSLRFVGGTPPYYHDGSAPSLTALVDDNHNRMGQTKHLSPQDRAALVAYLETL